jgi:DNA polymerase/3'-5' exonuclease PolX
MEKAEKFPYDTAYAIAVKVRELLRPHCDRIEIAGSIRRQKAEVGDIEICCVPKPYEVGLFESGLATIVNKWEKVKGDLLYGVTKYTQRKLKLTDFIHCQKEDCSGDMICGYEGRFIKLDLFIAEKGNWGTIFSIRTGSADYSHRVLASGWVRKGYKSEGGFLYKNGVKYEVLEEEDLFEMIGISYVEPKDRFLNI